MGSGMLKIRNFSCSYIEEGEIVPKIELFFLEDDRFEVYGSGKQFDSKELVKLCEELKTINSSLIFKENESVRGCDGYSLDTYISDGYQSVEIDVWAPEEDFLEGDKKTETLRWYRIIKAMVKVLNENGIDFKPWNM